MIGIEIYRTFKGKASGSFEVHASAITSKNPILRPIELTPAVFDIVEGLHHRHAHYSDSSDITQVLEGRNFVSEDSFTRNITRAKKAIRKAGYADGDFIQSSPSMGHAWMLQDLPQPKASEKIDFDHECYLDLRNFQIVNGEKRRQLTLTEFKILSFLAQNPNKICTRAELMDVGDVSHESFDRAIDVYIKRINRKFSDCDVSSPIKNRRETGFTIPLKQLHKFKKGFIHIDSEIYLDPETKMIVAPDKNTPLTPADFRTAFLLYSSPARICTPAFLIDDSSTSLSSQKISEIVKSRVKRLRRKLEDAGVEKPIKTEHLVGYVVKPIIVNNFSVAKNQLKVTIRQVDSDLMLS